MKIFGIGANRTATTSLTTALALLGFRSTSDWSHHKTMAQLIIRNRFDFPFLEEIDCIADLPIPSIYPELDRTYPGSKFILTIRDTESWLASEERHHRRVRGPLFENALMYGTWRFDRELFERRYLEHNARARAYFRDRPQDLLVLDICAGEGWSKLCPFLGREQPGGPFPHENPLASLPPGTEDSWTTEWGDEGDRPAAAATGSG